MALAVKKAEYPTERHVEADAMLQAISTESAQLATLMKGYQEESDRLIADYKVAIDRKKADIEALEKKLKKFMKKHRAAFFEEADRVDLKFGALILSLQKRVKRAKDVLKRLEEIGANEAIIVTKSVDWDVLEKWTDERLIEVGTERKKEEKYAYELYGEKSAKG
jgi:hypothetical protein